MKRSLLCTVFAACLTLAGVFATTAIALAATPAGEAVKGKHFINGIDKDFPPFAFIDEKGKAVGFDVESLDWIAKKMGFTVEHKPYEWKSIVQMLVEKKIDMVDSGMTITPERAAQVNFSEPYFKVSQVFVAKKGSPLTSDAILKGDKVKLGVQQGTNESSDFIKWQKEKGYTYQLVQYATSSDAIADLLNGRIAAAAMDTFPAKEAMRAGRPIDIVGTFGDVDDFGVAVHKDNKDLLEALNEGYKMLKSDPYWEELKKKYGLD